jgi:hypothetical protein
MLSQSQPSDTFDPGHVLQQVWRGDCPPAWRVFFGPVSSAVLVLLVTAQVILALMALFFLCSVVLAAVTARSITGAAGGVILVGVIMLVLIGLIVLLQHGVRVARSRASQKPRSTMVVMPEGVVAYRRRQTRSISFTHIAQMQLRVRARKKTITSSTTLTNADGTTSTMPSATTIPAAPSIWLDLVLESGQRGVWRIDIAPQDAIAQSIIEAYTLYRTQSGP